MATTVVSWEEATGTGAPAKQGAAPAPATSGKVVPWAEAVGLDPLVESVKRSQTWEAVPGEIWQSLKNTFGGELTAAPQDAQATVPVKFFGVPVGEQVAERGEMGMPAPASFAETKGGAVTGMVRPKTKRAPEVPVTVAERVGQVAGTAMQASDMVTATARQLLGIFPYAATYITGRVLGEDDKISAQAAALSKEMFLPQSLFLPWARFAQALGPEAQKAYENNPIGWVFGKIGEAAQKGTVKGEEKTGLASEHFEQLLDTTMGVLMKWGVEGKVKANFEMRQAQLREKFKKPENPVAPAASVDTSVPYDTKAKVEPVDLATRKTQLDEQIKAANQERQAAASKVREAAKYQKLAEKESDPVLKEALQKRADLATEELHATLTKQAEVKAEQAAAVEAEQQARLGGTTYEVGKAAAPETLSPGDANRIMQASEIQEVLQTPGHLRSAEQLIKLRGALRRSKEAGFISDPNLQQALKIFGLTAGVGAAAVAAWKELSPESLGAASEWLQGLFEKGTPEYNMRYPEAPGTQDWMPEWPRGDDAQQPRLFVTDKEIETGLVSAAMLVGAIKTPGGFFPRETITQVAKPFLKNVDIRKEMDAIPGIRELTQAEQIAKAKEVYAKATAAPMRMVKNWLTKYAGTPADPLNDITIPVSVLNDKYETVGTKPVRWENLIDQILKKAAPHTAGEGVVGGYTAYPNLKELPANEASWVIGHYASGGEHFDPRTGDRYNRPAGEKPTNFETLKAQDVLDYKEVGSYITAFKSFMEHVSDYYRTLDPVKRNLYDLPRLVKETLADDAKKAKEASAYKESSKKARQESVAGADVIISYPEVELPERLLHRNSPEGTSAKKMVDETLPAEKTKFSWIQLKKPGQFYDEGRFMGHSVGGYDIMEGKPGWTSASGTAKQNTYASEYYGHGGYEAIKSGKAEIYSLRDGSGNSFATFEVRKFPDNSRTITQMKGPGNQIVSPEAQRYAQDFATDPRWKSVREVDLDKIGFTPETFKAAQDAKKQNLGNVEQAKVSTDTNLPPKGQLGSADPKQLGMIAGAGAGALAGAALDEDNRIRGALLGAGAIFTLGALSSGKGLDYHLGALSTQLGNISDALKLRGRNYERGVMEKTARVLDAVHPFLNILKKVEAGSELDLALSNGDGNVIQRVLSTIPGGVDAYNRMQVVLKDFESKHQALGRFKQGLTNYFPRIVTDVEGLLKAIGQEQRTSLEEALTVAEAKMIKERARGLTDVERSLIIDQSMQARPAGSQLPGYARERGVKVVTPELRQFYASPTDSLLRYLSASVQDIELANFFGKDIKTRKVGGKVLTDVEGSIGEIVNREIKAKRITYEQADNLRKLLKSRFEGGEQTMAAPLQDVRNLTNVALLGQFGSAATQLGDSIMTIYHHGLMPTLKAVKEKLTGNAEVSVKDFGLVNHVAEELATNRATGKALQLVFKANGFSLLDEFAKGLNLNAGLVKNKGLAATEKGRAQLAQKYATAFGEEFPQLVQDLREGKVTENVKSLLFSELSDAQPISKMEMSPAYLDNPNGRILFQMKTYMLKQMDIIRRDGYQEIAKGNYVRGAKNLVGLASAMALSNIPGDVIKEWMSGRDASLDKIDYTEALLKNFGISRYTLDKLGEGKLKDTAVGMVTPAAASLIDLLKMDKKTVKAIPLGGRIAYDRFLGGNEAIKDIEYKRERKASRDRMESEYPSLREERLRKEREKLEKKLETIRNR